MKFFTATYTRICSRNSLLYLADSSLSAKGVFCRRDLRRGELIEECPLIEFSNEQVEKVKNTVLYDYYFILTSDPLVVGLAMGYGSVYNHNFPSNAHFRYNRKKKLIEIVCARDIDAGTEITINYNGNPDDPSPVYFTAS